MSNKLQLDLIERISNGLAERQWSQDELARRSGVAQSNISLMVRGKRDGSVRAWNSLLRALEDA